LASTEETKPNTTKANIHPQHKNTTTQNKHTKLKPGLVASYDLWPGNGAGTIIQFSGPTWGKWAATTKNKTSTATKRYPFTDPSSGETGLARLTSA